MRAGSGRSVRLLRNAYSRMLSLLGHIFVKSLWSGALKLPILGLFDDFALSKMAKSCGKVSGRDSGSLDLTMSGEVRIVFLVAPNGSERSEKLGSREHGAERLSKTCEIFVCA